MKATKKRIVTKLVSFILSVLVLFYAIPSVVYAETIGGAVNVGTGKFSAKAAYGWGLSLSIEY